MVCSRMVWSRVVCAGAIVAAVGLSTRAPIARAQAPEVVVTAGGPAWIDNRWSDGPTRRAEVEVVRGTTRVRAFEGRTVRTAAAAVGDVVALGYYHGGPEPFAGVVLVDLSTSARTDVPIPLAGGATSPLRPAALVIAAEPGGFALVLQEQQPDPSADVASTFARVGLDGSWVSAPHRAAIPWGLAALAVGERGEYELGVLFGGWGDAQAGHARVCVVTLTADGTPREHPWWATPSVALTDLRMTRGPAGLELFYRTAAGELRRARFAADGGWGQEPAPGEVVLRLTQAQAFYVRAGAGGPEAVAFEPR
jgi:hypothetical protein